VTGKSVALFVPPGWHRVAKPPSVPGLEFKDTLALAPAGKSAEAGLIAGRLSTGGHGPLPRDLVRNLRSDLHTQVVGIGAWDGYRYSDLHVAGYTPRLILYAVPTTSGSTAVACYATEKGANWLAGCERMARGLEIAAGTEAGLTELDRGYGKSISSAVGRLDDQRGAQRKKLEANLTPGQAAAATLRVSAAYGVAARSLATVSPPQSASGAHSALIKRLYSARDAYRRLAAAARHKDEGDWTAARRSVAEVEKRVSAALGDLGALGYGRSA
jgi:hypothetical protein